MKKISLPSWVYITLRRYGNVALPKECNDMDRVALAKHLSKEVGFEVVLTVADINESDLGKLNNKIIFKPFIKAEIKH